jgi:hypothetical protein
VAAHSALEWHRPAPTTTSKAVFRDGIFGTVSAQQKSSAHPRTGAPWTFDTDHHAIAAAAVLFASGMEPSLGEFS